MSVNNEYKRYFLILQEDDKGYEISAGKIPTGYVKIEIKNAKCKLTAFVQNIKSGDKLEYRFILVAPGKKIAVDVGRLMVDGSGRGELYHEFEADNVLKSNLEISEFAVAAITSSNAIPLSGYSGRDKIEWKSSYNIVNRPAERIDKIKVVEEAPAPVTVKPSYVEKKKEEKVEEVVIIEPVKVPKKKLEEMPLEVVEEIPVEEPLEIEAEEIIVEKPEVKIEYMPQIQTEFKAEIKIETEPIVEIKKEEVVKEEVKCEPCMPYKDYDYYYHDEEDEEEYHHKECHKCDEKKHKHEEEYEHKMDMEEEKHSYYDSPMYRKLVKVVDRLRKYDPFDEKDRNYEWFKVEDDIYLMNSAAIPFMGNMMPLGYPYMMEECALMIGKKDYIFGVKYDKESRRHDRKVIKYVFYGIPGMYNKREEMYYKMKGYAYFRPHRSNSYGYWIMCVDLRTGQVKM